MVVKTCQKEKNIYPQPGRKSNCFNKTWYFSLNCSTLETFILHWKHLFSNTSILFPICKCDMHFYFDYLRWYFSYICLFYVHWRRNDLLLSILLCGFWLFFFISYSNFHQKHYRLILEAWTLLEFIKKSYYF